MKNQDEKLSWNKGSQSSEGDYDHLLCTLMEYFDVE